MADKKKHSSTYIILICSYVAMVVVFTSLMVGLFLYSAGSITDQMHQMDEYVAKRTIQQADEMLSNLYDHGEMLVQDDRLALFAGLAPGLQKTTGDIVSKVMGRANDFTGLTTDLWFCPAGPDRILNKTGFHEGEDLEKLLQDSLGITAEEWREKIASAGKRSFQVVASDDSQGVRHRNFLMTVSGPENGDAGQDNFVAGIVPVTMLSRLADEMRPEGYEDIIAEYPEGIYSFSRQSQITREELEEKEKGRTDILSLLFSEKPIHVATAEGSIGDWQYKIHFLCPLAPYRNTVLNGLKNLVIAVLIVLVLGSVLLYFSISSHNRPLRIIMDRISGRREEGDPALRGEYRIIDQAIGALQEKQQGTETRLAEYRTRLQKTAVHQLLREDGTREESLAVFFRQQELDLHAEQCRVLLLALDADTKMEGLDENRADNLLQCLLEDVENRIYQFFPNSCCVITDDCVECLICSGGEAHDKEKLHALKESLMAYCRENGMHFYAAVSQEDTGTEGARRAFQQAETILDHATMTGLQDVILDEFPEQRPERAKSGQEIRQQQLLEYVNEHYTDASLSVLQMADVFDMSPSSVSRTFKQAADTGLNTYINILRVARAKELIETTHDSLKTISEKVGYGNQITMIRAFKKLEGVTPREYRDRIQDGANSQAVSRSEEDKSANSDNETERY